MTLATWDIEMQAAARAALMAVVAASTTPRPVFAWEGEAFTPAVGQSFIAETFRPDMRRLASVGRASGTTEHRATVALVLKYPAGKGTKPARTMAGLICDALKPGTRLERNGCAAWVVSCDPRPAIQEPDWLMVPVNIGLMGHSNN